MATIRKQGKSWRADVKKNGIRKSASFSTKQAAKEWAATIEAEILAKKLGQFNDHTFAEAIDRYLVEVNPKKKSYKKDELRLEALKRDFPDLTKKLLHEVTPADMAKWRDTRLRTVSVASVLREMNTISSLFTTARKEWGWCAESPLSMIEKPPTPAPRERRIYPHEVKMICRQLGYVSGKIETKTQEVALAFLIALRTGMRSGEILSINNRRVNFTHRVVTVPHKTQHITGREREIPITKQAARLIGYLQPNGGEFTVTDASRDTLFRKARDVLGIKDLHFHDARAEALTRLSRKVDVMTLARISGHRDIRILQNTYYRETAADIAKRL